MIDGVPGFNLLIVLKDGEAKADILSEGNTTANTRLHMYPGFLERQPDKEVRGDVRGNTDSDTGSRGVKINVSDGNMTGHTIQAGSGKAR
ncbi:hypothetical protein ES708_13391 [subsurface metagenome]